MDIVDGEAKMNRTAYTGLWICFDASAATTDV
jgi:hypothetical protein